MGGTNCLALATVSGLAACPTAGAFANLWLTCLSITTWHGPGICEISARVTGLGHTVFDCDARLLIFTGVGGGTGFNAGASALDCANLELALFPGCLWLLHSDPNLMLVMMPGQLLAGMPVPLPVIL